MNLRRDLTGWGLVGVLLLVTWSAAPAVAQPAAAPATRPATSQATSEHGSKGKPRGRPEGESKPDGKGKEDAGNDNVVVTDHELALESGTLKYRATAGTYAMKDEGGKHKADVFFVAYDRLPFADDAKSLAERPITFVFNGGPGAAAVWLHLGTAGPQRVKLTENGEVGPPPYTVVDNAYTWLDATDLVFIDPVGTGFSRPASGEDGKQFYGVEEDLRWVSDFIRLYTTRNGRWPSPKFLAGESYGTTRAAAISERLLEQQGIALNGIVLISTVLNFQTLSFAEGNEVPYALFLPTYTAVAHYHKKLPPDLQADLNGAIEQSEQFALGEYTTALARGSALDEKGKADVAAKLSRFTGLPVETVLRADLRIDASLFRKMLLNEGRQVIGRFDARITGFDPDPLGRNAEDDPSFNAFFAAYAGAFNDYVRRTLRYESDVQYDVLTGRVQPWNYGPAGRGYLNVADNLQSAMRKSPHMRVMVCNGIYDLATPQLGAYYTVDHMKLSPELRKNVTLKDYPGGHMMYHVLPACRQLHLDVKAFIEGGK